MKTILTSILLVSLFVSNTYCSVRSDTLKNNILLPDSLRQSNDGNYIHNLMQKLPVDDKDSIRYVAHRILTEIRKHNEGKPPEQIEGYQGIEIISFLNFLEDEQLTKEKKEILCSFFYQLINGKPIDIEPDVDVKLKKNKNDEFYLRLKLYCVVARQDGKTGI